MKKLMFSILILAVILVATGFSIHNNTSTSHTEEYAFMELSQSSQSRQITLATTIGEEQTTYESLTREKKEKVDWGMVVKKMNALNAQGFELLNTSIAASEDDYTRNKYHSYTFVRKVK